MYSFKNTFLILFVLVLWACSAHQRAENKVHIAGALRDIMHKNDVSTKVYLDTLPDQHLYAVGALDSLRGEILIEDGKPYISMADSASAVSLSNASHEGAALLVYANVNEWQSMGLPDSIRNMADLERLLTTIVQQQNLTEPLPFRLEGIASALDYHIIRNAPGATTHEEKKKASYSAVLTNTQVEITGFYSGHHQGVFTHMNTKMHMHMRNDPATVMGHVEALELGSGMKLFIPAHEGGSY